MLKFYLFITGCQYNYYDAKNLAHLMQKMGYVCVNYDSEADIIIVLACSVRQKPIDRIFGKIKKWRSLVQNPKIIVTGCILSADKKKLKDKVDAIIKTDDMQKELSKLLKIKSTNYQLKTQSHDDFYPVDIDKSTALVPIMQGCNNFCTYCAVPYVRGPEKSRPMVEIIEEIKKELKLGKKHILLLGQNVNKYSAKLKTKNSKQKNQFIKLLTKIDILPGNFTYNFLSANPRDFSDKLIELLPKLKKWEHLLHLPLQSGDDKILKTMNRNYTVEQYYNIIKNLKLKIPASSVGGKNLSITTDILVGFPNETKHQFHNTVNLCKKINFDKAYISQYSPRTGTFAAENLVDNVSKTEKKKRWLIINELINQKKKDKPKQ